MRLGLLTAAMPDESLTDIATWAAATGFEALEIAAWPPGGGVSHLDVTRLTSADAERTRALLDAHLAGVSTSRS